MLEGTKRKCHQRSIGTLERQHVAEKGVGINTRIKIKHLHPRDDSMQAFAEGSVSTACAGRRARIKKRHSGEGAMSSRPQMHAGRRSERRTCRQDGLARRAGDWGEGGDQRQRWRRGGSDGVGVTMRIRQAGGGGGGTRTATGVGVRTTRATTTDGGRGMFPGGFRDWVSWNHSPLCCGS